MFLNGNQGFVKMVILIVAVLIVLGYFGYNVQDIINAPTVQSNLNYVWNFVVDIWNRFLAVPAQWIWDNVIINTLWRSAQELFVKMREPLAPGTPIPNY